MIVFKQKDFSDKLTKILYGAERLKNRLTSKGSRESGTQLARRAIIKRTELRPPMLIGKGLNTISEAKKKLDEAAINPSQALNKGIEFVTTKPAAAATVGAWMGTIPMVPGTTATSIAVEKVANKIPAYRKLVKKVGDTYRKSGLSRHLANSSVSLNDFSRYLECLPH